MNPLLDDASVAEGILAITRRDGLSAVTARSLASELHVSLGALYNYTTSMLEAMQNADRHVYAAIASALEHADDTLGPAARQALGDWATREMELVGLVADLNRPHAPLPLDLLDLVPKTSIDLPRTPQVAEILRSLVGLWHAGSPDLGLADVELLTDLLASSLDAYDPTADYGTEAVPIDRLHALAIKLIEIRPNERIDDAVRAASVEVLVAGEWSFRKLQNKTGLPLARLNRMSPRDDHVMTAVGDIIGGIVLQHISDGKSVIGSARSVVSTVAAHAQLLIGAQVPFLSLSLVDSMTADSGLWAGTLMDERQAMLACGLAAAVLHAGYSNRENDPASAAASVPLTIEIAERTYRRLTGG